MFGVCAVGVKVSCELVEVASYLTALGKQGGNNGQGFFSAAGNDDRFLNLCLLYTSDAADDEVGV